MLTSSTMSRKRRRPDGAHRTDTREFNAGAMKSALRRQQAGTLAALAQATRSMEFVTERKRSCSQPINHYIAAAVLVIQ